MATDELEFEAVGGVHADALGAAFKGSPYDGTLPFLVELHVHCRVIDDDFVVAIERPGAGGEVVSVSSPHGFPRDVAVCRGVATVLGLKVHDTMAKLTRELANFGYRFIATPTGGARGFTEELLLIADPITELDAALALGAEPGYIFDLLDAGADPMRLHIKYGRPYQVARLMSLGIRPDYLQVVEYMRACGAH